MGPYTEVEYNLTLCRPQSRLQNMFHGQPYARVDITTMPELTLSPSQGLRIRPLGNFRRSLLILKVSKEPGTPRHPTHSRRSHRQTPPKAHGMFLEAS
jgi:hypothetical protein